MKAMIFLAALLGMLSGSARCDGPIPLIDAGKKHGGWRFGNGAEFPGAKGTLELASERLRDQPVLALRGDFSGGGNYVQASIALPDIPVDTLSFWLNAPAGCPAVPIRLVDGSGQCHQLKLKVNDKGGWQHIVLPVDDFFRKMGTAAALDVTTQYEKWGGANDGRWHQPGRLLVILNSRDLGTRSDILFGNVLLCPARPKTAVRKSIPLDEMLQSGELDWEFNLGQEFPGARGGLDLVRDQPEPGRNAMWLHADFTGGGAYVGMRRKLSALAVQAIKGIHMKMRSDATTQFALRLVDGTGQCHQRKTLPFTADGEWHDVEIVPAEIAGGEHWGGANDGKWHDSVQLIELMLNARSSESKKPDLTISDIRADVIVAAEAAPPAYAEGFDALESLGDKWRVSGDVRVAGPGCDGTPKALRLERTLEALQVDTVATGAAFSVAPGMWRVQYACRSDLHSPDNSYHGSAALEVLNSSGGTIETIPLGIGHGRQNWQDASKTVQLPRGASRARFRIELKKTYGSFRVDALSASRLKVQPVEQRIERILLATDATGNLFLPGDDVVFHVSVEAIKPLPEAERTLRYSVRDYRGAEQMPTGKVQLNRVSAKKGRFTYTADIAVAAGGLQVGKYYELHAGVPQSSGEPVTEYSGFAVLSPAVTRQHAPEAVPFTIRNWDSRIPAYFHLADRLGLRMIGVWGGWSAKPPYKPSCPGIDLCEKLGAKWITGTPAAQVERKGFEEYSEDALRKGMRNFLEAYADKGMAMIAMGNEPHGTGQKVLENVRAYRAVYETVKAFDPGIHVMGTSVEPNEEYFRAGYQNYLDSYDFHIYEHYTHVRRTMREYRDLMEKYHAVKPIHSTELGLNSQGQTRLAVSREMIKKLVSFFAEGGATVSWFTIQYPDPKGKARGQFGDSHCMFDCKYDLYNPRLDAITHYHLINSICVKKFVEEKHYPGGVQAYLFRDAQNHCLQVLWLDGKREDVLVPLVSEVPVQCIAIDGARRELRRAGGGVALTVSDDPVLLLYDGKDAGLAASLGDPAHAK